jgi:hypothetical protein
MAGAPVSWASKRQAIVALLSTKAKYIALAWGAQQAMWMASFLDKALLPQDQPFTLLGNNLGSIALMTTTKGYKLLKHLDIRHHFIWDLVDDGKLTVWPIQTHKNLADIMTKPLSCVAHNRIVWVLGLNWKRHVCQGEC